jgi:hypothetical protein
MKKREGWVSNSSSTSFIVLSKKTTKYEASQDVARRLFDVSDSEEIDEETLGVQERFLINVIEDVVEAFTAEDYAFAWEKEPADPWDRYRYSEERVERLDTVEQLEKYLDGPLPEKFGWIRDKIINGYHLYRIDLPDFGEGGTGMQTALKRTLDREMTGYDYIVREEDVWDEVNKTKTEEKT